MLPHPGYDRVSEAVLHAARHWEVSRRGRLESPTPVHRAPVVAISRETGTHGPEVARLAGERLDWAVYDHQLLELIAHDLHVRVKLLESVDERHVPWLQECVEAFAAVPAVRENTFVHRLIETLLSLGTHGRCVIVGRGSPFVLPRATTLRVRLFAPLEHRVAEICRESRLERGEAARLVARTDHERLQFVKQHFHRDPREAEHYDLILNTSQLSPAECAAAIAGAVEANWPPSTDQSEQHGAAGSLQRERVLEITSGRE